MRTRRQDSGLPAWTDPGPKPGLPQNRRGRPGSAAGQAEGLAQGPITGSSISSSVAHPQQISAPQCGQHSGRTGEGIVAVRYRVKY